MYALPIRKKNVYLFYGFREQHRGPFEDSEENSFSIVTSVIGMLSKKNFPGKVGCKYCLQLPSSYTCNLVFEIA